ncbi:MAG: antitoxin Xre/MbcA/ParS toxin-binding domain-containing protein [Nitrospirota bacterium]
MKRITEIAMFAAELMGARNASIWLDTPNEGLDGKKPSEIWNDPTGAAKVETLLFKIKRRREL